MASSDTVNRATTASTPPTDSNRWAHAASTAMTPRTRALMRRAVRRSPRKTAASSAVATGFIDTITAPSTAGEPCIRARYRQPNCSPWLRRPATRTCPSSRPVGHLTPAAHTQMARIAAEQANRNTNTAIGDMAETASAPMG